MSALEAVAPARLAALDAGAAPEAAHALLMAEGYVVVRGLADPATMGRLAAETAPLFGAQPVGSEGNWTKRIHSRTLAVSPTYGALVTHPFALALCDRVLTPNCVRYQLSSIQGIQVFPGAADQDLHRDDAIFRLPRPRPEMELNMMWAVDDFTAENGATRLLPGSHRWGDDRRPANEPVVIAAMPRGSLLVWLGSTWHGAGANRSRQPRTGAYVGYSLGWLRQEETLYLALPPAVARRLPEPLQRLVGYEMKGSLTLGWVDGGDPRRLLEAPEEP